MPHLMRGISRTAFSKLEAEISSLGRALSDDQLLEVADSIHALIRGRRSARPPGRVAFVYAGLNDNRPLVGRSPAGGGSALDQ